MRKKKACAAILHRHLSQILVSPLTMTSTLHLIDNRVCNSSGSYNSK